MVTIYYPRQFTPEEAAENHACEECGKCADIIIVDQWDYQMSICIDHVDILVFDEDGEPASEEALPSDVACPFCGAEPGYQDHTNHCVDKDTNHDND